MLNQSILPPLVVACPPQVEPDAPTRTSWKSRHPSSHRGRYLDALFARRAHIMLPITPTPFFLSQLFHRASGYYCSLATTKGQDMSMYICTLCTLLCTCTQGERQAHPMRMQKATCVQAPSIWLRHKLMRTNNTPCPCLLGQGCESRVATRLANEYAVHQLSGHLAPVPMASRFHNHANNAT